MHHTSAYVSIRQHTSAYVSTRERAKLSLWDRIPCTIRRHTSAYVSIRQHTYTSAYVSLRERANLSLWERTSLVLCLWESKSLVNSLGLLLYIESKMYRDAESSRSCRSRERRADSLLCLIH